eukprot:CAMPEP_0117693646 /NCGR_PEP_ID=MMETSP0804-20121206/26998_1 /TAXON_ID=1074897 /ORGANISM="Tetraselmis astigmatica, Strain CCMP880" /LENGTH=151 /DNA_ID=CAMNT_0005507227 /DNA_START=1351 /DNA_END=1807 /DNA_ORIENTATION=+
MSAATQGVFNSSELLSGKGNLPEANGVEAVGSVGRVSEHRVALRCVLCADKAQVAGLYRGNHGKLLQALLIKRDKLMPVVRYPGTVRVIRCLEVEVAHRQGPGGMTGIDMDTKSTRRLTSPKQYTIHSGRSCPVRDIQQESVPGSRVHEAL